MKISFFLAAALLLLPFVASSQQEKPAQQLHPEKEEILVPWTSGITAGFSVWPFTKERLRLGYTWEHAPNRQWVHELAYINAINSIWEQETYGDLEGALLRTEYRMFDPRGKRNFFYHSFALSYMYTRYQYRSTIGMECEGNGGCAYFRRIDEPVPTHTTTLTVNAGWLLQLAPRLYINFYGGTGFEASYFPQRKTDAYFGRWVNFAENDNFLLQPRFRLGASMLFALQMRSQQAN